MKTRNFWPDHERALSNFFFPLARKIDSHLGDKQSKEAFFEFESVFASKGSRLRSYFYDWKLNLNQHRFNRYSIWYSGELRVPPKRPSFDAYLSYLSDNFPKRNFYLPLWVLGIDWFGTGGTGNGFTKFSPNVGELVEFRKAFIGPKVQDRKFCCAFIGNSNALRSDLISELRKIGEVDVFGPESGHYIDSKEMVARNYRFMICMENTYASGYVTEKLLEAYLCETFPLYWGHDSQNYFNKNAFLNLGDFSSMNEYVDLVAKLNSNHSELEELIRLPLLNKVFDLDNLIFRLAQTLAEN